MEILNPVEAEKALISALLDSRERINLDTLIKDTLIKRIIEGKKQCFRRITN